MTNAPLKIDWASERGRLDPFVRGLGGVVLVEYRGMNSAWGRFNAVLKHWHARIESPGFSLRIDPAWFTTHAVDDVLFEFERKLAKFGFAFDHAVSGGMNLMVGNEIGGNATFNLKNVSIDRGAGERVQSRRKRTDAVVHALGDFLKDGRCMLVVQHHRPDELRLFWRFLWENGLDSLVGRGLFLVRFHDLESGPALHDDVPAPTSRILLPNDVSDEARWAEIYDDLIDIFVAKGMAPERSSEAATTILAVSDESIALLHANVAKRLLTLERH